MFGELIGVWCADTWLRLGRPAPCQLVELGPGRGTLMVDALRATRQVPGFHDALQVLMVEISPALRERQRAALGDHLPANWLDNVGQIPEAPLLLRSEEHTSELQSLMRISYAVFCLKKKNQTITNTDNH